MKRTLLIAICLLAGILLAGTATAKPKHKAKVDKDFFGVMAVDPSNDDYDRMADTGFGVSRFELSWGAIQTTREGPYNWSYADARMIQIAKAGMEPSVIVYGTPRFVRKNADGFYPPTNSSQNMQEWKDFLQAAVHRYGPDGDFWDALPDIPKSPIHKWLIWNEQNARAFWKPRPDPADYAKLVKASSQAIREKDPKADIVLGGMYGYPSGDHRSMTAVAFLKKFYKTKNIAKSFDAINVHPYRSGVSTVRKQIAQARSVAKKAGDGNVDVLVGELGWASSGPSKSEEVVGKKGQATRLRKGLKMLVQNRKKWNILGAYVYLWNDFTMPTSCLWCPRAGLVDLKGNAKPALKAVRQVIKSSS